MSTHSNGALQPPSDITVAAPLEPRVGDIVRCGERLAVVDDVAALSAHDTYVTISFLDGRGLPLCLPATDLAGADLWRLAGQVTTD